MSIKELPLALSDETIKATRTYFSDVLILPATKILKLGKVSISFSKRNGDSYYVVTGIVRDEKSLQVKIVYKSRLTDSVDGPISSRCDCVEWSKEHHCKHAVALYLGFHLQDTLQGSDLPNLPSITSPYCATPNRYGSIIKGPHEIANVPATMPYSSLQYMLTSKKVINFPVLSDFNGTLAINVTNINTDDPESFPEISFSHIDNDSVTHEKITLFEGLYLFNWETASAMHIPHSIRELLKTISNDLIYPDANFINNTIRMILSLSLKGVVKLFIDGVSICDLEKIETICHFGISKGKKKHHLHLTLKFVDKDGTIAPVPTILQQLTFSNGLLRSFKKKLVAYEFLNGLKETIETGNQSYKQILLGSSSRSSWLTTLDHFLGNPFTHQYDFHSKKMFKYDPIHIKKLISSIIDSFGPSFYRFSINHPDKNEVVFEVGATTLFQGLSQFTYQTTPYKIMIYYDNDKTKAWSPSMRFERRNSAEQWFDIELNISDYDLEIIKQADIETGLSVTDNGLVLLTKEQIDILKFIKRYSKEIDLDKKKSEPGSSEEKDEAQEKKEQEENKFRITFNRARIFELFEMKKLGLDGALTEEELETCNRLKNLTSIPDYPLPKHLESVMRPYQKTGHNWLQFLYENKMGACLADDMGLGKTLQVISLIETLFDKLTRILIVSPVSLILNWENEFDKFTSLKAHIYHGGGRTFPDSAKIILTSYGVMKKEHDKALKDEHFDILVLDEVQQLKNIRSLGAFAARQIKADFKICVTGTPVENDLAEFYNIIDLGIPGIWGDLNVVRTISNKNSRDMAKKIAAPFILRRTKKNVLKDLPPKIQNDCLLTFNDHEKESYSETLATIKKSILSSSSKTKYGEILKGLLRLRQRCLWNLSGELSTKVSFLMENLEQLQNEGHQAIIFSQFTTYLDIIEAVIRKRHWRTSRIDGSQSIKKRQEQLNLFQSGKNELFLISLKAGGVGLNLTAASYVFIMDPWWNPAVESQAIDRAHRIGQTNTLTVYRPIIKDSIEEKVLKLQDHKRELFNDLLPENEANYFTGRLSMKDFEHLLTL